MSIELDFIRIDDLVNQTEEIALTLEAFARGESDISPRVVNFLGYQLTAVAKAMREMIDARATAAG